MSDTIHDPAATRAEVEKALSRYPSLADRIYRGLLIALHGRGVVTIDEINARARAPGKASRE